MKLNNSNVGSKFSEFLEVKLSKEQGKIVSIHVGESIEGQNNTFGNSIELTRGQVVELKKELDNLLECKIDYSSTDVIVDLPI